MKLYNIRLENKTVQGLILKRYREIIIVLSNGKFLAVSKKAIKSVTEAVSVHKISNDNQYFQ